MILPTGTTVAVADGETIRLFHNTGVKPGVHLVEVTGACAGSRFQRASSTAQKVCAASVSATFPWRSSGKVDICWDTSLAPDKTRAEIVFERQTRQREL
jgi:hypothetical protein